MAITTLTLYTGSVPLIGQTQTVFDTNTGNILTYLKDFGTDLNARVGEINTDLSALDTAVTSASDSATAAGTHATNAELSATIALNASNYKGDWVAGYDTTGYSQGMSVTYTDGQKYVSKVDTNLVEPTTLTNTTEWDYLEAVSPADLALKQPILSPSLVQIADASLGTGTHTFDYSLGNAQQLTATGNITIAFSNMVTGKVNGFLAEAVNWGAFTITMPAGLQYDGKTLPTLTASGKDVLYFYKNSSETYTMLVVALDSGVPA